jgi:putative DNA primase/helicase
VLHADRTWRLDDQHNTQVTTMLQKWCTAECNALDTLDKQLRAAWAANEAEGGDESWNESYGKARERFKETRRYWRGRVQSRNTRKAITEDLRSMVFEPAGPDAFDANPDVLAVANGLLDLRTGALRPLRAEDMVTQRLTVAYKPDAPRSQWQEFLEQVIVSENMEPDHELIAWLQRLVGYAITGHATEQIFVLMTGKGANGKGVLTRALRKVLRAVTANVQVETLEQSRSGSAASGDLARLNGARLVFGSEPETGARFKAGLIKQITGGDPVTARYLYRPEFEFTPKFLVLISTNSLPTAIDASDGYWRRARVVPFRRQFELAERDGNIDARLATEAEGILAWAVEGARAWYAKKLGTTAAVDMESDQYRASNDRLGEFIDTRLEVTGDTSDRVIRTDVWLAYRQWADDVQTEPMRDQTFYAAMSERPGVKAVKTTVGDKRGVRMLTGIRILDTAAQKQREVAAERETRPLRIV